MLKTNPIPFATSLHELRSNHAAVLVSKFPFANHRSVQFLADKRCRWLTNRSYLFRLMRKKRRKKKLKKNLEHLYKKNKVSFSTFFLHYYFKTTKPVIDLINNISPFCDRCNDCKVVKLFKKRRKYLQSGHGLP